MWPKFMRGIYVFWMQVITVFGSSVITPAAIDTPGAPRPIVMEYFHNDLYANALGGDGKVALNLLLGLWNTQIDWSPFVYMYTL